MLRSLAAPCRFVSTLKSQIDGYAKGAVMTWFRVKRSLPALLLILFVSSTCVWGQFGASTIRGTITDPSGAVLAGATVTITNRQTNLSRTQITKSNGSYSFELIPPGDYKVEIEAKGFKKSVVARVQALVGSVAEVSQVLQVGEVTTAVVVEASAATVQVNTQDATLGNNIENQQILDLPLDNRRVADLLTLQPGVTPDGYVAGARSDQSNVTLDGVDINDQQTNQIGAASSDVGQPVLRLNAEAIEEFRVTTVNANANEGRSSGAQINLVSKSGTNNWHGALFEFYRGTLFAANDWFNNKAQVPVPPLVRNTFGGALGGPIKKDKVFFFYSYEGMKLATSTPVTRIVPLASLGQGTIKYSYCTTTPSCNTLATSSLNLAQNNAAYSSTGINPAALTALAQAAQKYPSNDTTVGDGLNTGGFRFNAPTPVNFNSESVKLDYVVSRNQNVFVRVSQIDDHITFAKWLPDTTSPATWAHPFGLVVGHTWTIGSNIVNSAHYGYTRQAFSNIGDSTGNDISFRFVFQPTGQTHNLSRVTPVHNITDDVSWTHGKHIFQFGANMRAVSNARSSFANAFDNAVTNPSFYLGAGDHVSSDFQDYLTANSLPGGTAGQSLNSTSEVQNAATAIIGRFSQYTANFTFDKDGKLLPAGMPTKRNFATQAYEMYFLDAWKFHPHLTFTLGLRYSLERPVYETQGFEVQPVVPLGTYFQERLAAAAQGKNFDDPIIVNRSGPANNGKPLYNWDKNNFQPRVAVAWSPSFSHGLLNAIFGKDNMSVLRGGFSITNDYYGQALAVDWDLNNTLGFTSNFTTPANTYDTGPCATCSGLAPSFTGFNQNIHTLPGVVVPPNLTFPLQQPQDQGERIETSVDSNLQAPTEYVWNLTFERQISRGTKLSFSYIGRQARHLLARRDVVAFNDIVDPKSGMDWYTAGTMLEKQRQQGVATAAVAPIPFFEDLFPAGLASIVNATFGLDPVCGGGNPGFVPTWTNTQVFYAMQSRTPKNPCSFFAGNDWTDTQALLDQVLASNGFPTRFMQSQYGALSAWSTIGNSSYNGLTVSLRQRLRSLTLDVNYTFSHSLDDASGLQNANGYGSAFIVNPIRQNSWYGNSDFDIRQQVNATAIWQLPFGRGQAFLNAPSRAVQALLGGWKLSGVSRFITGLPLSDMPFDDARWATNWNVQANVTPTGPLSTCPDRSNTPKVFGTGCDIKAIYQSFRNAFPGETGPRNYLRQPAFMNADMGLAKTFDMPWNENHKLQLRWDVFNVANFQPFGAIDNSRTGFGVARDPKLQNLNPPSNWSNFTAIQGKPRQMQIAARYVF
jgi:Carboxypeptidase regulatory-like domain